MELAIVPSCVRILAWWSLQEAVEWPGNAGAARRHERRLSRMNYDAPPEGCSRSRPQEIRE
ncbi:uncharacterized protein PHACADRAFT_262598 [Phanerochaete carnosa HHB-10118-sp]|uniref:Uncharacterized protein n=1 Tax=Phanerochaete carnosa (strain HHB-10118-sp) TaxID=650164 RepID=K5WP53_PHACS|nr:uncharacterized protein PHACADRAFT_262598 [Phanerochaete carnosa HHB-10118-sp]EKM52117.1 hypothetical protein PHACADRAFT_262598 [Phanerochaete carnosa HHB-10118-sp]